MNIWEKNVLPREISHLNATSVDQSIEFSEKKNRSLVVNSIFYPLDSFVFAMVRQRRHCNSQWSFGVMTILIVHPH